MKFIQANKKVAKRIFIKGLVQGVGFRPFVYRLTNKHHIQGYVKNTVDGVFIHAEGDNANILSFISDLSKEAPPASHIDNVLVDNAIFSACSGFSIKKSEKLAEGITNISPDIAVCGECINEMELRNHRQKYPFINCTHCGPRFTIIRSLPYDREVTSMAEFEMCEQCHAEYVDIENRRYHAQPTACNHCGPEFTYIHGSKTIHGIHEIVKTMAQEIKSGQIIAVKGLGGYNILCDATNAKSILQLRKLKHRDSKPFAVLFPDLASLSDYAILSAMEKEELLSWRRPIVIVNSKNILPQEMGNGFHTIGAMLPYLPLHYMIFKYINTPLICTSGNLSDEPIIINDHKAISSFRRLDVSTVYNNRKIVNRADDSVVKVISDVTRIIRRSRGYVPEPVYSIKLLPQLFGAGAELSGNFALSKENLVIPGQYIGDLKNAETIEFYQEAYLRFCEMYRFKPQLACHDLHPDYLSTSFAKEMNVPTMEVQHHHAHIASCLFENQRGGKAIGICFDGTGMGKDGNIWGSEFFISDMAESKSFCSFNFVTIAGGDQVVREPWRTALGYLMKTFKNENALAAFKVFRQMHNSKTTMVLEALKKKLNTHQTRGMGRLFDAVAALTGICIQPGFHAEAPMRLENIVNKRITEFYTLELKDNIITTDTLVHEIVNDIEKGVAPDVVSTKFHNAIIEISCTVCNKIKKETGLNHVALSGGVFQNSYLLEKLEEKLAMNGFGILQHKQLPYNDGNIAVGQIASVATLLTI